MARRVIIYVITFIVGVVLGICVEFGWERCTDDDVGGCGTDTAMVVYDTVKVSLPQVKDSMVVRYVTRVLKKVVTDTNWVQRPRMPGEDTVEYVENYVPPDCVAVCVPISQSVYSGENYRAWVSGYDAKLDSIEVYRKEVTLQRKQGRIGCVVGVGLGTTGKDVAPFVGVTIGYRLF